MSSATTSAKPAGRPSRPSGAVRQALRHAEQLELLSKTHLRLNPQIQVTEPEGRVRIVKNVPEKRYLRVDERELRILQRFKAGATAADILPRVVVDRDAPRLVEFYDLLLKAVEAGVLLKNDHVSHPVEAADWRVRLGPMVSWSLIFLCAAAGLFGLLMRRPDAPAEWWALPVGVALASLALSLGHLLAASRVRRADGEVYNVRMFFGSLVPHLRVDLSDAIMGGKRLQLDVACLRLAPAFLLHGVTGAYWPTGHYLTLIVCFLATDPFAEGAAQELLRALFAKPLRSTDRHRLFLDAQIPLGESVRSYFGTYGAAYAVANLVYGLLWLGALVWGNLEVFRINPNVLLGQFSGLEQLPPLAWVMGGLVGLLVLKEPLQGLWRAAGLLWHRPPPKSRVERPAPLAPNASPKRRDMRDFLAKTGLGQELAAGYLDRLVEQAYVTQFKPGKTIVEAGAVVDAIKFVAQGRARAFRKLSSGRTEVIHDYGVGALFNGAALVEKTPARLTVKADGPCSILHLPAAAVETFVVGNLGRARTLEIVDRRAFLERIPLCAHWDREVLHIFAEKATIVSPKEKEVILRERENNNFFFVIVEGSYDVLVAAGKKRVAVLRQGAYFGEISLLQNNLTTATIVAREAARHLLVDKATFLRALGHDPRVALQFEKIASQRLKKPVFPLSPADRVVGAVRQYA